MGKSRIDYRGNLHLSECLCFHLFVRPSPLPGAPPWLALASQGGLLVRGLSDAGSGLPDTSSDLSESQKLALALKSGSQRLLRVKIMTL